MNQKIFPNNTLHISKIVKKAQSRLYALNMLRRARVSPQDIIQIFCAKIRPVVEYAAPLWHSGLTVEQSEDIEHLQHRACKIAFPQLTYCEALAEANLPSLSERRESLL